jgi:hypothetical protein
VAVVVAAARRARAAPTPPGGAPTGPLPAVTKVKTPPKSVFPEGTQSLRLTKSTGAFLAPDGVDRIGNVAADTRVAWTETKPGKNCASVWVAVTPRGWICADVLEPSKKPPLGYEMPRLDRAEIVPGTYGRITDAGATTWVLNDPTAKGKGKASKPAAKPAKPAAPKPTTPAPESAPASAPADDDDAADAGPPEVDPLGRTMTMGRPLVGSTNVRKYGEITVAGKAYWKTSQSDNEWVLKAHISQHRPSTYQGARLADDTGLTLPLAFVWPKTGTKVWTRSTPTSGGKRQVSQRDALPILETHAGADGKPVAYRIGEGEWIDAGAVRVAELMEPPPLVGDRERWIDVDIDRQLLVAYEGKLPVFATMISGGKSATPTVPGIYRMWKKMSEDNMEGVSGEAAEDAYSVSTVPWTQYFTNDGLALHTSYWHDKFGLPRSHGCVNLAPKDARWMYFWSDPQVPPGWTMAAGLVAAPGSIVRVRSKDAPNPLPYLGYAKQVQAQREAKGAP